VTRKMNDKKELAQKAEEVKEEESASKKQRVE
jgi:hypothetical protein